ncbi:hypothetical protein [Siminovitchia terrae]|uniref:hypothetical protein n=1 Tax=Siminovitchia terrae TaxID=1914933 RepID=UPI0028A7175E|nr:hypothetical protein [Siminovitchia terrae]
MNAYWHSIQWGFKPRLNKVKASGGCHRFSEEIYRAELDKFWAQIRQGAFDDSQAPLDQVKLDVVAEELPFCNSPCSCLLRLRALRFSYNR